MKKLLLLTILVINSFGSIKAADITCPELGKYVVCYYSSWAQYRPIGGRVEMETLDATLCTHLVYTFAGLNLDGEIDALDVNDFPSGSSIGGYQRFNKLKEANPCVKTLLAIGGWTESSEKYSIMAWNAERREEFADRVERFLVEFGFDGLDFDWEYPTQRGGIPEDRENFTLLIKLLRERMELRNRLITVAVGAGSYLFNVAYDPKGLCEHANLLFIMGYDLHYPDITSVQAPLRRELNESLTRDTLEATVNYFISNGCPAEKIVLGLPSYGRTYTLANPSSSGLGAPVYGTGNPGPYTQESGFLGYNEICQDIYSSTWRVTFLENNVAKVAVNGNQWIGYDDPETITKKTQYAMDKKLGGVMFWSVDTDDFYGICHDAAYPLLTAANKVFGNNMRSRKI
jgi:chitinase